MTLPSVFVVKPDDGRVREFIQKSRPGIRRWVLEHYDLFRMQLPGRTYPGSHGIQPAQLFFYHLLGEYRTGPGNMSTLSQYDFTAIALDDTAEGINFLYPNPADGFRQWPTKDSLLPTPFPTSFSIPIEFYPGIFLNLEADDPIHGHTEAEVHEAAALAADVREGGRSNYFLLASLGHMLISNIRWNISTAADISSFFGNAIAALDSKQTGYLKRRQQEKIPPVFRITDNRYDFIEHIHDIFTSHPDFDEAADSGSLGLNVASFENTLNTARNKLKEEDYENEIEPFLHQEDKPFREVFNTYLKPLLDQLKAAYPSGQEIGLTPTQRKQYPKLTDDVKEGNWIVQSTGKKKKKITLTIQSLIDPTIEKVNVPLAGVFVPDDIEDLSRTSVRGNHPGLWLLELFADSFFYYENYNLIMIDRANHNRFTKNHFIGIDGTSTQRFNKKDAAPYGEYFADIRTDHMVAYFANLYHKFPGMRKSLEQMFQGEMFARETINWYTGIVSLHMNPVLVPVMEQQGLVSLERQALIMPQLPDQHGIAVSMALEPEVISFNLESPLLKDAFMDYMGRYNRWFTEVLIGSQRGRLYAEPFGPEGPGGKAPEKRIKKARDSYKNTVKQSWTYVKTSFLSVLSLPNVHEPNVFSILHDAILREREDVSQTRPSLPPVFASPVTRSALSEYLDYLEETYQDDPRVLAAVATAAERARVESIKDLKTMQEIFSTEFIKHYTMKAVGTVTFPALATLIAVFRRYITVPESQLNEWVARQLSDEMQAELAARPDEATGFSRLGVPGVGGVIPLEQTPTLLTPPEPIGGP